MGDYRTYLPEYRRRKEDLQVRSREYELWRNDLKDVDLGLLEDKFERAVRESYNKHLLVDAGVARLVLVLPSLVPHPVLSTILTLLFERWKYSTITLLPAPAMAVTAAGLRSGLVVDLGWEEAVITAIYEYREVHVRRSVRSMKALTYKVAALLESIRREQDDSIRESLVLDFDFVEEFIDRVGACHGMATIADQDLAVKTEALKLEDQQPIVASNQGTADIVIDWSTVTSSRPIAVSRNAISSAFIETLIGSNEEPHPDDHEQSVSQLLYRTLLALSADVRSTCMSRIIFTGRGANVTGLPQRILDVANSVIADHGWTPVRGKHFDAKRRGLAELAQGRVAPVDARHDLFLPEAGDFVDERLYKKKLKDGQPETHPVLRQADTLGPWAGASLVSSMKVRSFVEIEREKFLSHGLAGAHRDLDASALHQRPPTSKGHERTSWTLAGWG